MSDLIYHYTSSDVLEKIITCKKLRFTNIISLKDKNEYKHGVQLLKNKIIEYENTHTITSKFDTSFLDRFTFAKSHYSVSFSELGDFLGFWNSYYVPKTGGIAIGFNREQVFERGFIINPCIYGDPYPPMGKDRYLWFKTIFDKKNIINISKNIEYIRITFQTAHIKEKCFEIEKEWRAIGYAPIDTQIVYFKKNDKEVKFFDYPININSIWEVIIGPSENQELIFADVRQIINTYGLNCKIVKSTIPLSL